MEVVARPFVYDEHTFALALRLLLLGCEFLLFNLDVVFLGKPSQSLGIGELLVLHQEMNHVSAFSTRETLAHALCRRHHERRRLLVVKRAEALVVCSRPSQRYEFGNNVYNVGCVYNFIGCGLINHVGKDSAFP